MNNKFTKYTFTQRYGMEGVGDMEQEWMTPEEIEQSISQDKIRVQQLKDAGLYGQEYTQTIEIENDPTLDKPTTPTESYGFVIMDFGDEK